MTCYYSGLADIFCKSHKEDNIYLDQEHICRSRIFGKPSRRQDNSPLFLDHEHIWNHYCIFRIRNT